MLLLNVKCTDRRNQDVDTKYAQKDEGNVHCRVLTEATHPTWIARPEGCLLSSSNEYIQMRKYHIHSLIL